MPIDRNLDPSLITKEVIAARWLWRTRYASQNGGQLDFFLALRESEKALCADFVTEILNCPLRERAREGGG